MCIRWKESRINGEIMENSWINWFGLSKCQQDIMHWKDTFCVTRFTPIFWSAKAVTSNCLAHLKFWVLGRNMLRAAQWHFTSRILWIKLQNKISAHHQEKQQTLNNISPCQPQWCCKKHCYGGRRRCGEKMKYSISFPCVWDVFLQSIPILQEIVLCYQGSSDHNMQL